jgi:hypothetical protein
MEVEMLPLAASLKSRGKTSTLVAARLRAR